MAPLTNEELKQWKKMAENPEVLEVSEEAYLELLKILDNPPEPNEKLKKLMRPHIKNSKNDTKGL